MHRKKHLPCSAYGYVADRFAIRQHCFKLVASELGVGGEIRVLLATPVSNAQNGGKNNRQQQQEQDDFLHSRAGPQC